MFLIMHHIGRCTLSGTPLMARFCSGDGQTSLSPRHIFPLLVACPLWADIYHHVNILFLNNFLTIFGDLYKTIAYFTGFLINFYYFF